MIQTITTKIATPTPVSSADLSLTRLAGDLDQADYGYQGSTSGFVGATGRVASQVTNGGVMRNLFEVRIPHNVTVGTDVVNTEVKCHVVLSYEPKLVAPTTALQAFQATVNALTGTPSDGNTTLAERALVYGER